MAKSFNNLRVGKKFRLTNFGEEYEFEIEEIMADGDCQLKDINTLEKYRLFDLISFGKGGDFEIESL
ncbi:hypothetical protein [Roseivirga sp.]|jgi:hypothetical protein|uniref:hypothetical protein n=1 Tax=Roseivirga sp. TaxID=1964215 RepID=UPI000D7919FF|nr:hypothetical protein [Roseivirga sp.]PWL30732.1 MAG: hypothetical protein DCO95_04445 [Roseivirga sp. XM-24bin3]MBO6496799.1 hypothetical protein [Roseivirga sp.]MBO6661178.1 hypothetical protein [Roseivirga sp.]MBO6759814.1 hypothetical protein [Roseivirga sp.]MBO6908838.1 hypothetical protein [Roseivirga sp.]